MNYITDDIGTVVAAMRQANEAAVITEYGQGFFDYIEAVQQSDFLNETPFYTFGSRMEIIKRLAEKDKDENRVFKKYPLIALGMDVPVKRFGDMLEYNLNIAIMAFTDKHYTAEERIENVFKPVLRPLYEKFIYEFGNAGLFAWSGEQDAPPHEPIDRLYWGASTTEGNTANKYNDPIDAIEIVNLIFRQEIKC